MSDEEHDFFSLFGLPHDPEVDLLALKKAWYAQQKSASLAQDPLLLNRLNKAYQVLKDPVQRVTYLFEQKNEYPTHQDERNIPTEFLMKQFEWQEIIHTPAQKDAWIDLAHDVKQEEQVIRNQLFEHLRQTHWPEARHSFLLWLFLVKTEKKLDELLAGDEK